MKKLTLYAFGSLLLTGTIYAQAPERFSYQAVIRNTSGDVIADQSVGIRITLLQGSAGGSVAYQETFSSTSNSFGLVNLNVGSGTVTSGAFSSIDWGAGSYFMELALDVSGGTNYVVMGTSQLMSVPYALYSSSSAPQDITLMDTELTLSDGSTIDLSIIDTDTKLTEEEVDNFVDNNGYLTSEIDGDPANEIQNLSSVLVEGADAGGQIMTNLADPIDAQDAATKGYVDALQSKLNVLAKVAGITFDINAVSVTLDIDGNAYGSITIGIQTWMTENLKTTRYNDGTVIPYKMGFENNINTPAYFWHSDTPSNGDTYGALYNWYAVDLLSNGGKNICPTGWHVPSNSEWTMMEDYLIANGYNYDGEITGNKINKSLAATWGWNLSPNAGTPGNADYPNIRNKTGFTAFPGGSRYGWGQWNAIGNFGFWWSTDEVDADVTKAFARGISYEQFEVWYSWGIKEHGLSIRCLKD
jgi:uncharacterized protein (TIGR02145 family)